MAAKRLSILVPTITRARSAAIEARKQDAERRAAVGDHPKTTILSPEDVSGDYDAGRGLFTTFGGSPRVLTNDDLVAFRRNIAILDKRYKGGITAKDVINRSLPVDRDRANREIRTAIPVHLKRGEIDFVTNSGPESDVFRHYVKVILLNHSSAVASPKPVSNALALSEASGPLKFDCDCGRHTFWYRYIATIGRFNAGRDETGYPKIRNPGLSGVGCKHVLRVMKQLSSAAVLHRIAKMIEADRRAPTTGKSKAITITDAQARDLAEKQHNEAGFRRNKILTQTQRKARARLKNTIHAGVKAGARKVATKPSRVAVTRAKNDVTAKLRELMAVGGLTQEGFDAIVSKLNTKK